MNNETLHPVQTSILKVLLFKPTAKFSELNELHVSSDHFSFHVKRMVDSGFIQKTNEGEYELTTKGKEYANRFDTDGPKMGIERQAKIGVLVVAMDDTGPERKYMAQQRLKQPYYGFYGFLTGKIKWGETINEAAARELQEESGLSGAMRLTGIKHKMDYDLEGNLLEDKYFYIFRAENTKGSFQETFEGGKNIWLTRNAIKDLPDQFDGVQESIDMASQDGLVFLEKKYAVAKY